MILHACPKSCRKTLGLIELTMELELDNNKKLAKENSATVMDNLKKTGISYTDAE